MIPGMKKIRHTLLPALLAVGILLPTTSCLGFLDVVPENSQVADDYWQTEQDVENVLSGGYYYLRSIVESQLIPWGEVRAGLVYNGASNTKLQSWQMQPTSTSLCDWSTLYKVINIANTVLARAADACRADDTYSEGALSSHYCEARFLRALSYFYLVRNFRDVPLVLIAYEDDNVEINVPKSSEADVVALIKSDLLAALQSGAAKESFETTWETKGRATRWALLALMADVCLWNGDYDECITYCNALLEARAAKAPALLSTPSRATFMSIFNPGNSNESIFELQWNYEELQTNELPVMFDDQLASSPAYVVSSSACELFVDEYIDIVGGQEEEDGALVDRESVRTYRSSFYPGAGNGMQHGLSKGYVWKYIGSTTEDKKRTALYYDPHFIVYRVADVLLMKAEALLLVDGDEPTDEHKEQAIAAVQQLRRRAGYDEYALMDDYDLRMTEGQEELLGYVLRERELEFLGEGKIWYDMLRMGRRDGGRYRQSLLIDPVVTFNESAGESWLRSVLISDDACFLPIVATDVERNPNLVQNPYYN